MALIDTLKGSFSSGELSPRMFARQDVDRYRNGAGLVENFRVLSQGGLTRREGTRFCAAARYANRLTLVKAFEPSTTDAYILEFGHQYIRFFKNSLRIESPPGVPSVIEAPHIPYLDTQLREIRTAQSNDVMILVHPSHAPRRLSRLSDTEWVCTPIAFDPPPLFEAGVTPAVALTLSATTGTITATAAGAVFLPADAQRLLTSGVGRAIMTDVASSTVVTLKVLDAFTTTLLPAGTWTIEGSPVAQAKPDVSGPAGAQVVVFLQGEQPGMPDLVSNGSFGSAFAGWTVTTNTVLATGTHTGTNQSQTLVDLTKDFVAAGVLPAHMVFNSTDGSVAAVAMVLTTSLIVGSPGLSGGNENDFDNGDSYTVQDTAIAVASGGFAVLSHGGHIEQAIATVAGLTYQVQFRVADAPMAMQVGTASKGGDLLAAATYPVGEQRATFTATTTTSYLQFRNTDTRQARVTAISVKLFTMQGFRATEFPSYLRIHGGLIRVTDIGATNVIGEVVKELSTTDAAAPGAWTLESPAWSDALGWPSTVVLYEARLYFGGSARFPETLWGSAIDDLFNFFVGPNPADAVQFTLVDSGGNITLNRLRWLMPAENMLIGTTHGEYRLIGAGDDPITAVSPPRNRIQSTFGSDNVQPIKVGGSLLFAQRQGSKLREMSYDATTQTTFIARDITITSDHLLKQHRVLELAYQQEPLSTVWAVRSDGQALGLTYDQSEQVVAWWRMRTQGEIESIAVIPHPVANAHQVWMVVHRTIGTTEVRYLEYLDAQTHMALPEPVEMFNELTGEQEVVSGWDGLTMDCALVHEGAPTSHFIAPALMGATVQIVGDGAVFPERVMLEGGIDLPQAVSTCWIGLKYTPKGRCLPVDMPIRSPTGQGLKKRWVHLRARVEQTACLVLNHERIMFRQKHMPMNQGPAPFTGDRTVTPLGWDGFGLIGFEVDQPLPCTIIGIIGLLDTEVRGS